jgi:two-component system OmpR family sensor kinase
MSNAIKYNKVLGWIKITINKNWLEISNTWEWINKENLGKIFDRFYQESDSREENSFGIWLSLVKKIADIYNWKITVESQKWIETKFIINF